MECLRGRIVQNVPPAGQAGNHRAARAAGQCRGDSPGGERGKRVALDDTHTTNDA